MEKVGISAYLHSSLSKVRGVFYVSDTIKIKGKTYDLILFNSWITIIYLIESSSIVIGDMINLIGYLIFLGGNNCETT